MWKALRHQNVLPLLGATMSNNQFAMVSEWMVNGNVNEFVKAHRDANRFELVGFSPRHWPHLSLTKSPLVAQRRRSGTDVYARSGNDTWEFEGGMTSGTVVIPPPETLSIKGNILIDQDGRARLAGFELLTIISDSTYPTASQCARRARCMSPEFLDPVHFGSWNGRSTKESDCYAFGMVILEVLTGQHPLLHYDGWVAMRKVIMGEHPERPQGAEAAWFTDDLWETLEQCWSPQPNARPTVEAILEYLEQGSTAWRPLPPSADDASDDSDDECSDDGVQMDSDDESVLTVDYYPGVFLHFVPKLAFTCKRLQYRNQVNSQHQRKSGKMSSQEPETLCANAVFSSGLNLRLITDDPNPLAWKLLVDPALPVGKRIDLVTSIFSDHSEIKRVANISGDDAQAFINAIDEVSLRTL